METSNINELSLNFIDKLRLLWSVSKVSVLLRALAVQIGISSDCTKRNFRASNENVASKNGTNHLDIHFIRFESRRDLNSKVAINLRWRGYIQSQHFNWIPPDKINFYSGGTSLI